MTEINPIQIQTVQNNQNVQAVPNQNQVNTANTQESKTPSDAVTINNATLRPPVGVENPFTQNPFYQANNQNTTQSQSPVPPNYPFINESNFILHTTTSHTGNLWTYLIAGGLGLFTGLALGSLMNYGYYCYYPMYYSYFYSPWWYNCGLGYNWWCC